MMGNKDERKNETTIPTSYEAGELLQRAFKDNEDVLITIRALLFGYDLSEVEKGTINKLFLDNPGLLEEVQKKLYLVEGRNNPIGANPDFWIGVEEQIFGRDAEVVDQILKSKEKALAMLKTGVALLENVNGTKVSIAYNEGAVKNDRMGILLLARNMYMKAVEQGLNFIKIIAGMDLKQAQKDVEKAKKQNSAQ